MCRISERTLLILGLTSLLVAAGDAVADEFIDAKGLIAVGRKTAAFFVGKETAEKLQCGEIVYHVNVSTNSIATEELKMVFKDPPNYTNSSTNRRHRELEVNLPRTRKVLASDVCWLEPKVPVYGSAIDRIPAASNTVTVSDEFAKSFAGELARIKLPGTNELAKLALKAIEEMNMGQAFDDLFFRELDYNRVCGVPNSYSETCHVAMSSRKLMNVVREAGTTTVEYTDLDVVFLSHPVRYEVIALTCKVSRPADESSATPVVVKRFPQKILPGKSAMTPFTVEPDKIR
jgi:hypothetical protein